MLKTCKYMNLTQTEPIHVVTKDECTSIIIIFSQLRNVQINQMPVPASYNDITTDPKIRDYLGIVWYDRSFFVPRFWADSGKTWIRFSSVSYAANVVC